MSYIGGWESECKAEKKQKMWFNVIICVVLFVLFVLLGVSLKSAGDESDRKYMVRMEELSKKRYLVRIDGKEYITDASYHEYYFSVGISFMSNGEKIRHDGSYSIKEITPGGNSCQSTQRQNAKNAEPK